MSLIDFIFKPAFTVLNYPMQWIELIGVVLGFVSVWLSVRGNIWNWVFSIGSQIAYFFLFYSINLYSDMLLQIFFGIISIYGIINWKKATNKQKLPILSLSKQQFLFIILILILLTGIWGLFISKIHLLLPYYFATAAVFPYIDGSIAMVSIVAIGLQAKRYWQSWLLWTVANSVAIILYYYKEIYFTAILYFIFWFMGVYGWAVWRKKLQQNSGF